MPGVIADNEDNLRKLLAAAGVETCGRFGTFAGADAPLTDFHLQAPVRAGHFPDDKVRLPLVLDIKLACLPAVPWQILQLHPLLLQKDFGSRGVIPAVIIEILLDVGSDINLPDSFPVGKKGNAVHRESPVLPGFCVIRDMEAPLPSRCGSLGLDIGMEVRRQGGSRDVARDASRIGKPDGLLRSPRVQDGTQVRALLFEIKVAQPAMVTVVWTGSLPAHHPPHRERNDRGCRIRIDRNALDEFARAPYRVEIHADGVRPLGQDGLARPVRARASAACLHPPDKQRAIPRVPEHEIIRHFAAPFADSAEIVRRCLKLDDRLLCPCSERQQSQCNKYQSFHFPESLPFRGTCCHIPRLSGQK